jgi:hypothetical protein
MGIICLAFYEKLRPILVNLSKSQNSYFSTLILDDWIRPVGWKTKKIGISEKFSGNDLHMCISVQNLIYAVPVICN